MGDTTQAPPSTTTGAAGPPSFQGVDSHSPAYTKLGNSGKELHTWVRDRYPSACFFGRYISTQLDRNILTREECVLLHREGFHILIIYNGTNHTVPGVGKDKGKRVPEPLTSEACGERYAGWAITQMNMLLEPKPGEASTPHPIFDKEVFIYANIERYVNGAWILGWWRGFSQSKYGAGIYYSIQISAPYCEALKLARPNPPTGPLALFGVKRAELKLSCLENVIIQPQIEQDPHEVTVLPKVASIDRDTATPKGINTMWLSLHTPMFDRK